MSRQIICNIFVVLALDTGLMEILVDYFIDLFKQVFKTYFYDIILVGYILSRSECY